MFGRAKNQGKVFQKYSQTSFSGILNCCEWAIPLRTVADPGFTLNWRTLKPSISCLIIYKSARFIRRSVSSDIRTQRHLPEKKKIWKTVQGLRIPKKLKLPQLETLIVTLITLLTLLPKVNFTKVSIERTVRKKFYH